MTCPLSTFVLSSAEAAQLSGREVVWPIEAEQWSVAEAQSFVQDIAVGGVRWARPANYWWRPGGAIAAGAAVGFVTAATAAAWAGSPPAPGYCWYYTDASRQQGFWDACP